MAVKRIFQGLAGLKSGHASAPDGVATLVPITAEDTARRLELLDDFEQAGIGWLWASDANGRLIYISQSAAQTLDRPLADLLGQPLASLFEADPDHRDERSDRPLTFLLGARSRIADMTVRFTTCTNDDPRRQVWWSISGQPKIDAGGAFHGYRGSAKDITAEYLRKIEDSKAADFDSLTGLANRHRMTRRLTAILSSYDLARRSCALMMLDLDKFKHVNDTMGHPAGDDLLRQVAQRLRKVIGERAEIGRLGGDEFQMILPDIDDRAKLGELAEKVIQAVSQPYAVEGKQAIVGASIGIAIAPYDGIGRAEIVRSSDLALYAAKNGGRGQFRFYSADLKNEVEERSQLREDLGEALATGQLDLQYQPVIRTADNMVVGFEALMRWEHPERGTVGPDVFIPIAEESNLISQLGEWALRRACADALQWPATVRVAVNVSAVQFSAPAFPAIVASALEATGLLPDRLELELTESVFMGDSEAVDETFRALKELGVRLALDDFGTGYSSLSYLRSAPFDKIKVDRTFVDSCTQKDKNSAKIIAAIIGLSDALGMETTVEGVEAFDQLELVCSKGARFVQGFLYAAPLDLDAINQRLQSGAFRIEPNGPDRHRPERRSVFRRIGVIHEDHRYEAVMRNLSKTGARIEGIMGVPIGTGLVLDLGGGQLVVSTVVRSEDASIGVEFEIPLTGDGAGGLCTRYRVSPYALAAVHGDGPKSGPHFMQVAVVGSRA